jgi:hypothetical protein
LRGALARRARLFTPRREKQAWKSLLTGLKRSGAPK